MSQAPITWRCAARRLAATLALLAVLTPAGAQAASWRLEPIADSTGVAELHELAFDARGQALLSWNGADPRRDPPTYTGLATRDPEGNWGRPLDLRGIVPTTAQIHLSGSVSALLVARETAAGSNRRRLVTGDGESDGGFDSFNSLDEYVSRHWSAISPRGDAIVAWTVERSPFLRVAERRAGKRFARARDLALGRTAAVALNARGDRALVWRAGTRLAARVRRAGGTWSATKRFGRVPVSKTLRLSALLARNGRVVVTWGSPGRACGVSVRDGSGRWRTKTLERRCGPSGGESHEAPVQPIADAKGATYVAWTGRTRSGRRAVKFARVGVGGGGISGRPLVISSQRGAVLDDVAAGSGRSLAITYSAPRPTRARPLLFATFAAVRRRGGGFGRADRLTPADVFVAQGSRVAFQPLTGEPVVAVPFLIGRTVAVAAAVGPPAPAP